MLPALCGVQHLEAKRKLHSLIVCNVLLSCNTSLRVSKIVSDDVVRPSMWRGTEVSCSHHVTLNVFFVWEDRFLWCIIVMAAMVVLTRLVLCLVDVFLCS